MFDCTLPGRTKMPSCHAIVLLRYNDDNSKIPEQAAQLALLSQLNKILFSTSRGQLDPTAQHPSARRAEPHTDACCSKTLPLPTSNIIVAQCVVTFLTCLFRALLKSSRQPAGHMCCLLPCWDLPRPDSRAGSLTSTAGQCPRAQASWRAPGEHSQSMTLRRGSSQAQSIRQPQTVSKCS